MRVPRLASTQSRWISRCDGAMRVMIRWLVLICALCALPLKAADLEFEPVTIPVKPVQVSPRVWMVQGDVGPVSAANQGFNANAGFVVTDEGVVVFDALGSPALGAVLRARIREITPNLCGMW